MPGHFKIRHMLACGSARKRKKIEKSIRSSVPSCLVTLAVLKNSSVPTKRVALYFSCTWVAERLHLNK